MLFRFGGHSPLLLEDEPGESGTGDAKGDDANKSADDTAEGNAPAYVTQDALDASLKSLQDGLFSMVRKLASDQKARGESKRSSGVDRTDAKKTSADKSETSGNVDSNTADEVAQLRAEMRFRDAIDGLNLSRAQRQRLWKLHQADQPEDPEEWARAEADELGWLKPKETPKQKNEKTTMTPPGDDNASKRKPISDAGSPNGTDGSTTNDILSWTDDDVLRWFRQKGIKGSRHLGIQNRAALTEFRQMYEDRMRDVLVKIPRRGEK